MGGFTVVYIMNLTNWKKSFINL